MEFIGRNFDQEFQVLQKDYLENRTNENLAKMFSLLFEYYKIKIKKYAKSKSLYFTKEILQEKAQDAASYTIELYITRPDFKIEKLGGYGSFPFVKVMFNPKEITYEQINSSYEELIENFDNEEPVFLQQIKQDQFELIDLLTDAEMSLKKRQFQILKTVIESPSTKVHHLAEMFNCSRKEIKQELQVINKWLEEYNE